MACLLRLNLPFLPRMKRQRIRQFHLLNMPLMLPKLRLHEEWFRMSNIDLFRLFHRVHYNKDSSLHHLNMPSFECPYDSRRCWCKIIILRNILGVHRNHVCFKKEKDCNLILVESTERIGGHSMDENHANGKRMGSHKGGSISAFNGKLVS